MRLLHRLWLAGRGGRGAVAGRNEFHFCMPPSCVTRLDRRTLPLFSHLSKEQWRPSPTPRQPVIPLLPVDTLGSVKETPHPPRLQ